MLWATDFDQQDLIEINPNNLASSQTYHLGVGGLDGVEADGNGHLFIVNYSNGYIYEYNVSADTSIGGPTPTFMWNSPAPSMISMILPRCRASAPRLPNRLRWACWPWAWAVCCFVGGGKVPGQLKAF